MKKSFINDFKQALKKEGLKFTDQRYTIFKFLIDNNGHYDCDSIIKKLWKKNKVKVSRATAYRTLDLLVKYDFAKKRTSYGREHDLEGSGVPKIDKVPIENR